MTEKYYDNETDSLLRNISNTYYKNYKNFHLKINPEDTSIDNTGTEKKTYGRNPDSITDIDSSIAETLNCSPKWSDYENLHNKDTDGTNCECYANELNDLFYENHKSENINGNNYTKTENEFIDALNSCLKIFSEKLNEYGPTWRIMRSMSVTDQIFIKANRIKTAEISTSSKTELLVSMFQAIVNYGIVGLIQLELGASETGKDKTIDEALELYRENADSTYNIMISRNHDYGEVWRMMRICSFTDFILIKIFRIKELEEGIKTNTDTKNLIKTNYSNIIIYAIFAIIMLTE